jgi:CheY-like chemotaxis protein
MLIDTARPGPSDEPMSVPSHALPSGKVVIVNGSPEVMAVVESAVEAGHYGMVFIESIAHAYSQIKRVQPNLVILCVRLGDMHGLQVLSMLKLDEATRRIPVITYAAEEHATGEQTADEEESEPVSVPLFDHRSAETMN